MTVPFESVVLDLTVSPLNLTVNKFTPNINIDSASIFYNQTDNAVIAGRVYKFDGDFYDGSTVKNLNYHKNFSSHFL